MSVSDAVPFANVPLAPVVGAVKVTDTPFAGAPPVVAVTVSSAPNCVATVAVCGDPLVIMIATTEGLGLTLVTAPQLKRTAIRQTEAKIVPQALYSMGLPPLVLYLGRRCDPASAIEKFRSCSTSCRGDSHSHCSSHKELVVLENLPDSRCLNFLSAQPSRQDRDITSDDPTWYDIELPT